MINKKVTLPTPFAPNMVLREDSWLAISVTSLDDPTVIFYNADQDMEDPGNPLSFKDFAEAIFDEHFNYSVRDGANMTFSDTTASSDGGKASEQEDEDGKMLWIAEAQVINVYKEEKASNIPNLIKTAIKKLSDVESDVAYEAKDAGSLAKDPYAYYGVKRSDFI